MSKPTSKVKNRWMAKAYDRLAILVPKGRRETIAEYAASKGQSVNGLFNALMMREIGISESEWKASGSEEEDSAEE